MITLDPVYLTELRSLSLEELQSKLTMSGRQNDPTVDYALAEGWLYQVNRKWFNEWRDCDSRLVPFIRQKIGEKAVRAFRDYLLELCVLSPSKFKRVRHLGGNGSPGSA